MVDIILDSIEKTGIWNMFNIIIRLIILFVLIAIGICFVMKQ